MANNILH